MGRNREDIYDVLIQDFEEDRAKWDRSKGVPAWVVLPKNVGGKRPETLRLMLNQRLGERRYEVKVSVKKVSQADLDGENGAAYAGYKAGDTAVLFMERAEDDPYIPETGKGKGVPKGKGAGKGAASGDSAEAGSPE